MSLQHRSVPGSKEFLKNKRAHKLHKLLQRVLPVVVVVADGRVREVRARLLDDGCGGEVQR